MIKTPEYVTQCTLEVKRYNNETKQFEPSQCGRPLTMSQLNRNECPACHRPFREDTPKNYTQEMNRRKGRKNV